MNNILTILVATLGTVLTAVLTWGGERLIVLINNKIKSEKAARYLSTAYDVVSSAVKQTYQTYVEAIKGTDAWTPEAQKNALNATIATAKTLISTDVKNYITENFGDFAEWLTTCIEAKINDQKCGVLV